MGCIHSVGAHGVDTIQRSAFPTNLEELKKIYGYCGPVDELGCLVSTTFVSMLERINTEDAMGKHIQTRSVHCSPVCQMGTVNPCSMFTVRCKLKYNQNTRFSFVDLYFMWRKRNEMYMIGYNTVLYSDSAVLVDPMSNTCTSNLTSMNLVMEIRETTV